MLPHYTEYTAKDFSRDAFFWSWVTQPSPQSDSFWTRFVNDHPEKKKAVEEARKMVEQLSHSQQRLPEERVEQIWQKLKNEHADLDQPHNDPIPLPSASHRENRSIGWYKVAAAVGGMLLLFFAYLFNRQMQYEVISTGYGETQEVLLPDSSMVTLNANTEIRYQKNWEQQEREVWIEGEAFFSVQHKKNHQKFTVYADKAKVEVVGTEFTVSNRREKTQVVLKEGEVHFWVDEAGKTVKPIKMKPGELVAYSASADTLEQKIVDPLPYSSWTHNELIFEEATLQEILTVLEDSYGYTLQVKDKSVLQKKFTGTVPADEIEILLQGIAQAHHLRVSQKGKTVILEGR